MKTFHSNKTTSFQAIRWKMFPVKRSVVAVQKQGNTVKEKSPKTASCFRSDDVAKRKENDTLFAFPKEATVHNFYKCTLKHCQHLTSPEQSRLKTNRDRFVHSWLLHEEEKGMFCHLWKKHNTENQQNKSKVFKAMFNQHTL